MDYNIISNNSQCSVLNHLRKNNLKRMIKERKKEMQNLMKKTMEQKMKNITNHQKDSNISMKSFFRKFKRSTEKVKITPRKYTLD